MYKKLQEIAKQKGKLLLIENTRIPIKNIDNIRLSEQNKILIESNTKEQYESLAVLEGVDVTRWLPNANKRLYPKKLWEKVQKEKVAEGSSCFVNHSEESEDMLKLCGIWHNFRVDEKSETGKADLYLIGKNTGQLLLEAIKAGGQYIEFSTVGFGEFEERKEELQQYKDLDEDVEVVCWDSYDLDHLADWVHNSSQGVRATIDNIVSESKKEISEQTQEQQQTQESMDNNDKNAIKENINENLVSENIYTNNNDEQKEIKMAEKLNVTAFKQSTRKSIKEAVNNPNHKESYEELLQIKEDVLEALEEADAKSLLNLIEKKISEKIFSMSQVIATLTEANDDLEKELDQASASMDAMKEKYQKMEKLVKEQEEDVVGNEVVETPTEKDNEADEKMKEQEEEPKEDEEKPEEEKELQQEIAQSLLHSADKKKKKEEVEEPKEEPEEKEEEKPEEEEKIEEQEQEKTPEPEHDETEEEPIMEQEEEPKEDEEEPEEEYIEESALCEQYGIKSLDDVEEIKLTEKKEAVHQDNPIERYFRVKSKSYPELEEIKEEVCKATSFREAKQFINEYLDSKLKEDVEVTQITESVEEQDNWIARKGLK